jgi:HPr kinase/phosphorylase
MTAAPANLHASAVALGGKGVLILGRSGSGKSELALMLMALGCALVSDDRTLVTRGVGILRADPAGPATLVLAVDLEHRETARLPEPHSLPLLGLSLPLLHKVENGAFPAAIVQYLKAGRAG